MSFDMSVHQQSRHLEDLAKAFLYKKAYSASSKTNWIRLSGLGMGIISGLLTIATRIGLIFENMIKGLGNIFGSPCFKNCNFKRGVTQLLVNVPRNTLCLPFSILSAANGLISKPLNIIFSPQDYLRERWNAHDYEGAVEGRLQTREENLKKTKKDFEEATERLNKNPTDVTSLKFLAQSYLTGNGVKTNFSKSIELYTKAAELGDAQAIFRLGVFYNQGFPSEFIKDDVQAVQRYKALENEYPTAMFRLANMYVKGSGGLEKNYKEAAKLYRKAIEEGINSPIPYLVVLLRHDKSLENYPGEWISWFKKIEKGEKKLFDKEKKLQAAELACSEAQRVLFHT